MRLKSALVLATASLLLATVLLVAGSAYVSARRSAAELTASVLSQATDRIARVVRSQLDVASSESALLTRLFERGELRSDDPEGIARYATDVIASHPTLSYVSFAREANGELAQVSRDAAGAIRVRFLRRHGESLDLTDLAPEPGGLRLLHTELHRNENEPRVRPYYALAREAKRPTWTETYPFFDEEGALGVPGVTFATPLVAGDGALLGVITADFDLRATSRFLLNLGLFEHGSAFVVEYRRDGRRTVIAHPSPELIVPRPDASHRGLGAVLVDEIGDARVAAFARSLPRELPPSGARMVPVDFAVDGARFVGGFRALGGDDVRWVVCAFAPEDDVLGEVHRNDRTALVIVVLGTAAAVLLALWIGTAIARPLRAVADETEAIGQFRIELRQAPRTGIVEVARLAAAVEEMKRNLRSFRKYVPADVVRELVANGAEADLGGERRTLTIHFSDIAGFTTLAETISPEDLVAMLGEYFDEMTKPILASGGTVDKFIGDAVMAFWGAPRPDHDHALHACEAALANRDRLATLNEAWERQGRPRLEARTGLHTGEVIVGNVGSRDRLGYTVIGDPVNLASRLEGLNKRYGTSIVISDATYALVKDVVVARPLDRVSVKGKARAVDVYELIGKRGEVSPEAQATAERHTKAFALYLGRRFEEAGVTFTEIVAANERDVAARLLLERCQALAASPPAPEWDGTERLSTK